MRAHTPPVIVRLILFLCLILSFICVAQAQSGVAPGSSRGLAGGEGNNMIQGRIYFPSGQSATGKTIKISLESVSSFGGSMSTVADQDGTFSFRNLVNGGFTVVVDAGSEYEKTREPVTFDPNGGGRTVQVNIQLHPKVDSSNPLFANVPDKALNLYQKGSAAAKKGDSKAAAELLSGAVAAYPNFQIALSELGTQYMLLKDMDKAGETFENLLKLKPTDVGAHLNLGIIAFNKKKMDDAELHLRKALELKSAGPTAYYYLGLTMISTKKYGEAEKEFENAIKNGGENLALAHKYLGGLYMQNPDKKQEAANELEKYLTLDPKAPDGEKIKGTIKDLRNKQ